MKRKIELILVLAFVFSLGLGFAVSWAGPYDPPDPGLECSPSAPCCYMYDCGNGCIQPGHPGYWNGEVCTRANSHCHCITLVENCCPE